MMLFQMIAEIIYFQFKKIILSFTQQAYVSRI